MKWEGGKKGKVEDDDSNAEGGRENAIIRTVRKRVMNWRCVCELCNINCDLLFVVSIITMISSK